MTLAVRPENLASVQRASDYLPQTEPRADSDSRPGLPVPELAFRISAAFRAHPHISNVLTHISRARWDEVEQSLNSILDPATTADGLSPLARNMIDLMSAERGITGKIMKPHFHSALHRLVGPRCAQRLISHVDALNVELELKAQQPAPPAPAPSNHPEEPDDVRAEQP